MSEERKIIVTAELDKYIYDLDGCLKKKQITLGEYLIITMLLKNLEGLHQIQLALGEKKHA